MGKRGFVLAALAVWLAASGLVTIGACVGDDPAVGQHAPDAAAPDAPDAGGSCPTGATLCGSECVNTDSNGKHCGRCGHDCLGGECKAGACRPVLLASSQTNVDGLAIDTLNVYWITEAPSATLRACAKNGCGDKPTDLVALPTGGAGPVVDTTAPANERYLWWVERGANGGIKRCYSFGCGGSPETVVKVPNARQVILDGARFYYTTGDDTLNPAHVIMRCPKNVTDAGACETMGTGLVKPGSLVLDGTGFFVTRYTGKSETPPGAILHCAAPPCDGGTLGTLVSPIEYPGGLLLVGTTLVWVPSPNGPASTCAKSGCNNSPGLLSPTLPSAFPVFVEGEDLFLGAGWANGLNDGQLWRCPKGNCEKPELIVDQLPSPGGMVFDSTAFYFSSYAVSGGIYRLAR